MRRVYVHGDRLSTRLIDMEIVKECFSKAGVIPTLYHEGDLPRKHEEDIEVSIIEVVPSNIHNPTCRLCTKRLVCAPYSIFSYILHTDKRFANSPDHDDFFLHLGELCDDIDIEEGQRG